MAQSITAYLQHSDIDHHFGLGLVKVGDQFLRQYHLVRRAPEGDRAVRRIYLNPADVQNSLKRADHLLYLARRRCIAKIERRARYKRWSARLRKFWTYSTLIPA